MASRVKNGMLCGCGYALALAWLITGAEGTVAAELIPHCVEKLVQEDNEQLKV